MGRFRYRGETMREIHKLLQTKALNVRLNELAKDTWTRIEKYGDTIFEKKYSRSYRNG